MTEHKTAEDRAREIVAYLARGPANAEWQESVITAAITAAEREAIEPLRGVDWWSFNHSDREYDEQSVVGIDMTYGQLLAIRALVKEGE